MVVVIHNSGCHKKNNDKLVNRSLIQKLRKQLVTWLTQIKVSTDWTFHWNLESVGKLITLTSHDIISANEQTGNVFSKQHTT